MAQLKQDKKIIASFHLYIFSGVRCNGVPQEAQVIMCLIQIHDFLLMYSQWLQKPLFYGLGPASSNALLAMHWFHCLI